MRNITDARRLRDSTRRPGITRAVTGGATSRVRVKLFIPIILAAALIGAAGSPDAQSPTWNRSGGATQWMSPAVVATWITEQEAGAPVQLQMLILWRGTPGWFLRAGGSSSEGTGSIQGNHRIYRDTIVQGGVRLAFEYDSRTRVATVQGQEVDLHEDNVVLVDDVDAPGGARVSGTLRIARPMPGSAGQIGLVLRMSPEIMAYLRCDATVPEGPARAHVERLCLQNIGLAR
jgi:hypothetical protein